MKNLLLLVVVSVVFLTGGCKKDIGCQPVSPRAEEPRIVEYLRRNGFDADRLNNGIYYMVIDPGTGPAPSKSSKVTVVYSGRLLNDIVFDSISSPKTFAVSEVMEGWQICLPFVKKGGRILMFLPSTYAYGCTGNSNFPVPVPPDSVLVYDVTLIDIE